MCEGFGNRDEKLWGTFISVYESWENWLWGVRDLKWDLEWFTGAESNTVSDNVEKLGSFVFDYENVGKISVADQGIYWK